MQMLSTGCVSFMVKTSGSFFLIIVFLCASQITPILRGNFRMQGPTDDANCNLATHTVR